MRRVIWIGVAVAALVGVLLLFVLPGRALLQQRHALSSTSQEIQVLTAENAKLADRISQLDSKEEIERIARQEYGLVVPGERAYAVIPPTGSTPTTVPAPEPASAAKPHHHSFWSSLAFWN